MKVQEAIQAVSASILQAASEDDALDAFDEAMGSAALKVLVDLYDHLSVPLDPNGVVFGSHAPLLTLASTYWTWVCKIQQVLERSPNPLAGWDYVPAEILKNGLQSIHGQIAIAAAIVAVENAEPLPEWLAKVISEKVLTGLKAYLQFAALCAPTEVPESVVPRSERLDLAELRATSEQYTSWMSTPGVG